MASEAMSIFLADTLSKNTDSSQSSDWSNNYSSISELSEDVQNDDEDTLFFPLMHCFIRLKRNRMDDYLQHLESWTEKEFKNRFGLSRKLAHRLIDDLEKSGFISNHKFGLKPLEPRLCFYVFLSFISNSEPLTRISTKFDISISSSFRVIRRVIAWLLTKMDEAIKWPHEISDVKRICDDFHCETGISNMLGVIDCTHVKIEKPKKAREYCNSKGYFSIILQASVDSKLRFTNIYCGEPGSSSCSRVLKRSPIYHTATQIPNTLFPCKTFLVGHSGYPSLPWLVPPFRVNRKLTLHQREFNTLHAATKKISNKAFKLLKSRFKRIKLFTVYRNIAFITDTIVAACVLHNYCINENG